MKKTLICTVVTLCIVLLTQSAQAVLISLDAETPATGRNLDTTPLTTSFGTISFVGTVLPQYDSDMPSGYAFSTDNGAVTGSSGNVIEPASLMFDFDVKSVEFLYGGNMGTILVQALDINGTVVDSFFQNDTYRSQPIGPVTLTGGNIREVRYEDTDMTLVSLDNILIEPVPEPAIEAAVDIDPDVLNLKSRGKWITCYVWLPEPYDVADVNPNTILLNGQVELDWSWIDEAEQMLMAKFPRSQVQEILEPGDVELTISGGLLDGTIFEGTDTIRVID